MTGTYPEYLLLQKGATPPADPHETGVRVYADSGGALRSIQSDGTDTAVGGGGGSTPIQLATTQLTSAQILDLATTPVAVTPTPTAGTGLFVLQVWAAYHFVTTHYTGADPLVVASNYRGYGQFKCTASALLGPTFDAVVWFDQSAAYTQNAAEFDHTDLLGSPWSIKNDLNSDPPVGGDGTATIYCTYCEFTP